MTAPEDGHGAEHGHGVPFEFRDNRRIDPETGEVRRHRDDPVSADGAGTGDDSIAHLDFEPPADAAGTAATDELEAAQAHAAELLEDLQRERASFTNYRNRSLRDQEAARTRGVEDVLGALLPVLDDVERARSHGELEGPFAAIADKLDAALAKFGIERFGAVGEVFDPTVHEALMHQPDEAADTVTVQHVIEPGYRIGEKIVRAARVAVVGPQG